MAGRHAPGRTTQELAGARCRTTTAWLECRGCTEHAQKCREGEERAERGRREGDERVERGRRAGGERAKSGRREVADRLGRKVPAPLSAPTRSERHPAAPPDQPTAAWLGSRLGSGLGLKSEVGFILGARATDRSTACLAPRRGGRLWRGGVRGGVWAAGFFEKDVPVQV